MFTIIGTRKYQMDRKAIPGGEIAEIAPGVVIQESYGPAEFYIDGVRVDVHEFKKAVMNDPKVGNESKAEVSHL